MKKYLFLTTAFLISLSAFSQVPRSRILIGQDTSTGKGGLKYYDTLKTLVCSGCSFNHGIYADTLVIGSASQWTTSGSDIYYSTGNVTIGSSTINRLLTLDKSSLPLFGMSVSGTEKMLMGIANGAGSLVPGTVSGDFALRSVSGIYFSADNGTTEHMGIANSGDVTIIKKLGVGRAPTTTIDGYNATASSAVTSQSGLATGLGYVQALNNSGNGLQLISAGSSFVTSGLTTANTSVVQSNGSLALILKTEGGSSSPIIFGINTSGGSAAVEVGRFTSTGKFWLNQTSNIATSQFEVTQAGGNAQITTAYDATHYTTWNTGSGGILTIAPTGLQINHTGHAAPTTTLTYDLGTTSLGWRHVYIAEGANGLAGQVALIAGTKAITITGVTTSSRAFPGYVAQGGTSTGVYQYKMVCTSNTLTITAVDVTGSIVTTDTSTINYFIIN